MTTWRMRISFWMPKATDILIIKGGPKVGTQ